MSTRMLDVLAAARAELRHEPLERRIRADADGRTVVDSTRAALVWEPQRVVPSYAVPREDVLADLAPDDAATPTPADLPPVLHPGIPFAVHTAPGRSAAIAGRPGAGFLLDEDPGAPLAGHVLLDFAAFDAWREEDEPVAGHPRDPFHRVDVRRTGRPVRVTIEGELIAETTAARLVFETQLPTRFYLPRADVRVPLHASAARSYCPYKGEASYWSLDAAGAHHADAAWSYEAPLDDATALTGLIAFWDERVDVTFDGARRDRPGGAVADALRDEFGV